MSKKRKLHLGIIGLDRIYPFYNKIFKGKDFEKNTALRQSHRKELSFFTSLPSDFTIVNKNTWFFKFEGCGHFRKYLNYKKFSQLKENVPFYKILDSLNVYSDEKLNINSDKKIYIGCFGPSPRNGKILKYNHTTLLQKNLHPVALFE